MTLTNGNGGVSVGVRFTLSQVIQVLALVVAGLLAWGNLKGDIREGFAQVGGRLNELEHRTESLERADRRSHLRGR